MGVRVGPAEYPWWVRTCLWGPPGRAGAWAVAGLAVLAAAACAGYAARAGDARWYAGLFFLPAAVMNGLAIRWVDRRGRW
jgi:hypothetical protein